MEHVEANAVRGHSSGTFRGVGHCARTMVRPRLTPADLCPSLVTYPGVLRKNGP